MILLPLNTDAPIYHWPWMTLVLIGVNIAVFLLTGRGTEPDGWLLTFGHGLHPVEWLANNFLHFGIIHLVGNLIFLWAFGIVVEGKLGWWRFLVVYLLMGIAGGAIVQTAMLGQQGGDPPGSGGASLCIYGLLAIAIVWAPKNEMDCFLLLGYRAMMVELSILMLGGIFVSLQVLAAWWNSFQVSSAMLHLTGAILGFAVGFAFLKWRWVDCENWDLIAVWKNTYGDPSKLSTWHEEIVVHKSPDDDGKKSKPAGRPKRQVTIFKPTVYDQEKPQRKITKPGGEKLPAEETSAEQSETVPRRRTTPKPITVSSHGLEDLAPATRKVLGRIRELLQDNKPQAALVEYRKRLRVIDHWPLELLDLKALADGLYRHKAWDDALPLMREFLERFPGRDDSMQVRLAALYCEVQQRPRAALRELDAVDLNDLSDTAKELATRVRQQAEQLVADGVIELDGKAW